MAMTVAHSLVDQSARDRIRDSIDETLVVEAAAGTGKTTALVDRILSVLRSGKAKIDSIVAVTFTEFSAGELKLRLRSDLERRRSESPHFVDALTAFESLRIGTIHAFCADVLREYPVEAGVDPGFGVITDSDEVATTAFHRWFEMIIADPPEGIRRALRRRARTGDSAKVRLQRAFLSLVERRDFPGSWRRPNYERESTIDALCAAIDQLARIAVHVSSTRDPLAANLVRLVEFNEERERRERASSRDYDELEADLKMLVTERIWDRKGSGKKFARDFDRNEVLELRDRLRESLSRFSTIADADLAALLKEELKAAIASYEATKQRQGLLDFHDLLARVGSLLRENHAVRAELQRRVSHIFVDEFQDTDPLQVDILFLLASADPEIFDPRKVVVQSGKLFVVGDPKQSIYRFRRSDVSLYLDVKARLVEQGASVIYLTTSFRGVPELQSLVNASFAPLMTGGPVQAEYVPLENYRPPHENQPAIVALPVPVPYSEAGNVTKANVGASMPEAIAAFLKWLLEGSGWTVEERGERVPVSPRHVCLLFRHLQWAGEDIVGKHVSALARQGLPHVLVHGRAFYQREEILALRSALVAIEWPDDELEVYATLRGPLFGISDRMLYEFREAHGKLRPLRPRELGAHEDVWSALEVLSSLHRARNRRLIAETIQCLLEATRAHAGFALWSSGQQVLANVLRLIDRARSFESKGATSFRAFVQWLTDRVDSGERSEAPIVESETPGIRLMTVHGAKGLEFPVIVLCDPMASAQAKYPSRHVDTDQRVFLHSLYECTPLDLAEREEEVLKADDAESTRVSYVAATRARDLLVVPAMGDQRLTGCYGILYDAIYPAADRRRASRAAPGCPPFGEDSVLVRTARCFASPENSIRPGVHRPLRGDHTVTWWDPALLPSGADAPAGLRYQTLLSATDSDVQYRSAREYAEWKLARATAIDRAQRKTRNVLTVTAAAMEVVPSQLAEVAVEFTERSPDRPSGARFGTLVHAVLEVVPFDANPIQIEALTNTYATLLEATDAERCAAREAVFLALAHPRLREAAVAAECSREVALGVKLSDGRLADGVVDLAYRTEVGWTVVDFKTDMEPGLVPAQYAAQVEIYAVAIRAATGAGCRAVLLGV